MGVPFSARSLAFEPQLLPSEWQRAPYSLCMTSTTLLIALQQTSDPGWLTQPLATILAACIAIGAASIAYLGVLKTTSTQRNEKRRSEVIDTLVEALDAVANTKIALASLAKLPRTMPTTAPDLEREFAVWAEAERRLDALEVMAIKLQLFGYEVAAAATHAFFRSAETYHRDTRSETWEREYIESRNMVFRAYQDVHGQIDRPRRRLLNKVFSRSSR